MKVAEQPHPHVDQLQHVGGRLVVAGQLLLGRLEHATPERPTACALQLAVHLVERDAPGKPRSERVETERFRSFTYDELVARDKANLDITWLKDDSLEDLDNLPAPEIIAREIVEDLTAALAEFEAVAAALETSAAGGEPS